MPLSLQMATPQRFSWRAAVTTFADSSSISTLTANTLHRAAGRSESSTVESVSGSDSDINEDADEAFIQFIENWDSSDEEEDRRTDPVIAPDDTPITDLISRIVWDFRKVEPNNRLRPKHTFYNGPCDWDESWLFVFSYVFWWVNINGEEILSLGPSLREI